MNWLAEWRKKFLGPEEELERRLVVTGCVMVEVAYLACLRTLVRTLIA